MTYIVTDTLFVGNLCLGQAAGIPSDERICSICWYGAAEIHPVRQVILQSRLRLPYWPNTESFRAFISDRIVLVDMDLCRNCLRRCNMRVHAITRHYTPIHANTRHYTPLHAITRVRTQWLSSCVCMRLHFSNTANSTR